MIKENREPRFYYSKKDESNFVNMILSNKFQNSPRELLFVNQAFPKDSQAQNMIYFIPYFSNLAKIYKS